MPTYNRCAIMERHRAKRTPYDKSLEEVELIVVDDGSRDANRASPGADLSGTQDIRTVRLRIPVLLGGAI